MEIGRRPVLQGLAATGIATEAGGFRPADDRSPIAPARCIVLTERTQGDGFLAGVRYAIGDSVIQETGSFGLDLLMRILASREQRLLLGLVDDDVAAIVVEMARGADARLRWLGHHDVRGVETRHRLLTAARPWRAVRPSARRMRRPFGHHRVQPRWSQAGVRDLQRD
jgi:hypothetical protein